MACTVLSFPQPVSNPGHNGVEDWLKSQARVTQFWIDQLIAKDGDVALIAVLDQHAAFLQDACSMLAGETETD